MSTRLSGVLTRLVRDVPDFPEPGIVFKDITPLLADPTAFRRGRRRARRGRARRRWRPLSTRSSVIEARGFILAAPVALALGVGFVPVRKAGKLPGATHAESYALEYGEAVLEVHEDAFAPGDRVLVVDDVLATGGTVEATHRLIAPGRRNPGPRPPCSSNSAFSTAELGWPTTTSARCWSSEPSLAARSRGRGRAGPRHYTGGSP